MQRSQIILAVASTASIALIAAAIAPGCLSSPELKNCIDFASGTDGCESGCDLYCENAVEVCPTLFTGDNADDRRASCLVDCAGEPVNPAMTIPGQFNETSGNTLECRLTFVRQRQCENVGLLSSVACVGASESSCEEYCTLMQANCPNAYPSPTACRDNCVLFPSDDTAGDAHTLECRLRNARLTETSSAACEPASLTGGDVCGTPCEPYCDLVMLNCTDGNRIYEDRDECLRVCDYMRQDGNFDDWTNTANDTVQCRSYHAGPVAAGPQPAIHCPHTRVYNEEQCRASPVEADWPCITFCDIMERFCPDTFPDQATCRTTCAGLPEVTDFDPATGPQLFPLTGDTCPTF